MNLIKLERRNVGASLCILNTYINNFVTSERRNVRASLCILNKYVKTVERRSAGASLNRFVQFVRMALHVVREEVWNLGTATGHEG